ncbi:MAG TPA: FAD-binding oxidoreductase [Magnetospirillaceae bacterium]
MNAVTDTLVSRLVAICGAPAVIAEPDAMTPYQTEWRQRWQGKARLVVRPGSTEEVSAVVKLCATEGVAIVPQGGNTGLCEGAMPDASGKQIVLSLARMNRIRNLDPLDFTMTVDAGCVLQTLQEKAREAGCFFPLSLGAQGSCMIGGNISTNAGGVGVLRYGSTRALVLGLEVVLADGAIWDGLKALGKDNTGYDLKQFFIGAEGSLGIITAASLKLFPQPQDVQTALVALTDLETALPLLRRARSMSSDMVTAFEVMPRSSIEYAVKYLPGVTDPIATSYDWYALMDLSTSRPGGSLRETMEAILGDAVEAGEIVDAVIADSTTQQRAIWRIREELPEAVRRSGPALHHDVSVPTSDVAKYIRRTVEAVQAKYPNVLCMPFGHLGDGNIHFTVCSARGASDNALYDAEHVITPIIFSIAVEMRGSFSAEHGVGQLKLDDMDHYKKPIELDLMQRVKAALDPRNLMNPGKVVRAKH